ncbi:MAG: potassium/proton antiporter [Elusimicrobia bacterium]|nr:potassium/proton antiporter [Elusimicrobiota bacterium]
MLSLEIILIGISGLLIISIIASKASSRLGVPSLLFFLVIGMLAGSEGIDGRYFSNPQIAQYIGIVALIFILFLGGLETEWKNVRTILFEGLALSTIGILITALLVACFTVLVLKFSIFEGLLLGSIVSSTDAAAIFSILRSRKISLTGKLRPLLEFESGSNDPMAVFLTVSFIGFIIKTDNSITNMFLMFVLQMGLGTLLGYVFGKGIVFFVNKIKLEYDGLYPVLTMAMVLLTYAVVNALKGSGFLAIYIVGLIMGNSNIVQKRNLIHFHNGLAWLMQITMFLTLGLLVFPTKVISITGIGLIVSMFLMFLARPISVFITMAPTSFNFREKILISWVGLRGSVPIILATFSLIAGIAKADMIFNIVFFIVLTSILLQGTSIPFMAKLLKVDIPFKNKKKYPLEFEYTDDLDTRMIDFIVPYNSWMIDKPVSEIGLPQDSLITLIARNEKFIVPSGQTKVESEDVLLVLVNNNNSKEILDLLGHQKK